MLTPHSIWWDNSTNALLAWGSRCAAVWGPSPGNWTGGGDLQPPTVAAVPEVTSNASAFKEVLLEFDPQQNTSLLVGGSGAPPLAPLNLNSSGVTVAAVIEPPPPANALVTRTVVVLGNTSEGGAAATFDPVVRLGLFENFGDLYVECTAWPLPEVQAAADTLVDYTVLAPIGASASRVDVACILDPRVFGA